MGQANCWRSRPLRQVQNTVLEYSEGQAAHGETKEEGGQEKGGEDLKFSHVVNMVEANRCHMAEQRGSQRPALGGVGTPRRGEAVSPGPGIQTDSCPHQRIGSVGAI
jgi:hypothetical protein